jgi:hypothetical protein
MPRKPKAPIQKPMFDEESILRFAALGAAPEGGEPTAAAAAPEPAGLCLRLKPDVITLLRAEADRKGKTIDQVVAKLVSKHLGKR